MLFENVMNFVTNFKIKKLFSETPQSSFIIEILGKTIDLEELKSYLWLRNISHSAEAWTC